MTAPEIAEENAEKLIVLTERLVERLSVDALAFEARAPLEVAGRMEETQRLANLYRHESARVKADPGLVAGASPRRRLRLMSASKAFEAALARHGRALYAAKEVTEGVVRAIAEEVVNARSTGTGYGPTARAQETSGTAITLNRRA